MEENRRIYRILLGMELPQNEDERELADTNAMLNDMALNTNRVAIYFYTCEKGMDVATIDIVRNGRSGAEYTSTASALTGDSTAFTERLLDAVDTLIAAIGPADERIEGAI